MYKFFTFLPKNKQQWKVFISCIFIAFSFWGVKTLSDEFTDNLAFELEVDLEALNEDVILDPLPNSIILKLKGSGFDLLRTSLSSDKRKIKLDLKDFDYQIKGAQKKWYLLPAKKTITLKNNLPNAVRVIDANLDSLIFYTDQIAHQKLPVKTNVYFNYDSSQYHIKSLTIAPDSIDVYGAYSTIMAMDDYSIDSIHIDLKQINTQKTIQVPKSKWVKDLEPKELKLEVLLDPIKKHSIKVPIQCKNCPKNLALKLFPAQAELSFYSGVHAFESVKAQDFKVYVDYQMLSKKENLTVHIESIPIKTEELKMFPATVEYIIQEKNQ